MSKGSGFFGGAVLGIGIGTIIGILVAPRSGEETRAMLADSALDLRDRAYDAYEQGAATVAARYEEVAPALQQKREELRSKLDMARERMDAVRTNLSDTVNEASKNVSGALNQLKDNAAKAVEDVTKKQQ